MNMQTQILNKLKGIFVLDMIKSEKRLNLAYSQIWIEAIKYHDWSMLKQLTLTHNNVNDQNFILILKATSSKLTNLRLDECMLSWRGIKQMGKYQLENLQRLELCSNIIGNSGIKYLVRCNFPHLKKLSVLNLVLLRRMRDRQ